LIAPPARNGATPLYHASSADIETLIINPIIPQAKLSDWQLPALRTPEFSRRSRDKRRRAACSLPQHKNY
jgi:hypothetical protein